MPEILLEDSPIYPGVPVRDDIEIYDDTDEDMYKVRDKDTGDLIVCIPKNIT